MMVREWMAVENGGVRRCSVVLGRVLCESRAKRFLGGKAEYLNII